MNRHPLLRHARRHLAMLLCMAVLLPAAAQTRSAGSWPAGPLRVIVPSLPGSPSDLVARMVSEQISTRTGQPVVVDNKVGANGQIGMREAARAEADGQTIVIGYDSIATVNPFVYAGRGFDPRDTFVPLSILSASPLMLVCGSGTGIATLPQLIEQSKQQQLVFGSGGIGSPGHLTQALLTEATGIQAQHVPYRGPPAAVAAVVGGEVQCGFLASAPTLPHVKSGKLKALAVSSARPSPLAPDVKPVGQLMNRPSFDASFLSVVWVHKDTPAPVQTAIERLLRDIGNDTALRDKMAAIDQTAVFSNPAQARQTLQTAADRWAPIVKRLDLKPD